MPVPSVITDLSATASSNSPAAADAVFPDLDNYLRAHAALIRQGDTKASNIASNSTVDLGAAAGRVVDVTGTTPIISFGTVAAGVWRIVRFTGSLIITHNATSLILPGGANITTSAGDTCTAVSLGSGNWLVTDFMRTAMPAFYVTKTGETSSLYSTGWSVPTYGMNLGSGVNTSNGGFTAPVTGIYHFSLTVTAVNTSGSTWTPAISLGGDVSGYLTAASVADGATESLTLSGVLSVSGGSVVVPVCSGLSATRVANNVQWSGRRVL